MLTTILSRRGSASARQLSTALSAALERRVRRVTSAEHLRPLRRFLINWGCSNVNVPPGTILSNSPAAVAACVDKLATFRALRRGHVSCVEWTTSHDMAEEWLRNDGKIVVRHTTTGHSGAGLEIVRTTPVPEAPLYTRYFRKQAEFRVHIGGGEVLLLQQKRRRNGVEHAGDQHLVRSHGNGWVFTTRNLSQTADLEAVRSVALQAVACLGLQHGAADILLNADNTAVVCEVNTAPSLSGDSTLRAYAQYFLRELRRYAQP